LSPPDGFESSFAARAAARLQIALERRYCMSNKKNGQSRFVCLDITSFSEVQTRVEAENAEVDTSRTKWNRLGESVSDSKKAPH
jgi:hypothetical protein